MGVPCAFASTTMLVVLEEATQVCDELQSCDGGHPPHVPPQPSVPHDFPLQLGVQLAAGPPSDEVPELLEDEPPEDMLAPPPDAAEDDAADPPSLEAPDDAPLAPAVPCALDVLSPEPFVLPPFPAAVDDGELDPQAHEPMAMASASPGAAASFRIGEHLS